MNVVTDDPVPFIQWCISRLTPRGSLYLEWPSPASMQQPNTAYFKDKDIPLIISNYKDDPTHQNEIPDRELIKKALSASQAFIVQEGVISNPYFEEEVLAHFNEKQNKDAYALTMAYWSRAYWAQYLVATVL